MRLREDCMLRRLPDPSDYPNPGATSIPPVASNSDSTRVWHLAFGSERDPPIHACNAVSRARLTTVQIWPGRPVHACMTTSEPLGLGSNQNQNVGGRCQRQLIGQDAFGSDEAAAELIR